MLKLLRISNYALIDFLEINLEEGLTIITGETGAGKSIIMGALSLLLGQRFDAKIIRNNEKKSVIEACFRVTGYNLENIFASNDIDDLGEECILRREILPNGRTRAFVNDTPVNLVTLEVIALSLVDIHSQHSNALLLKPEYRLQILDSLADNEHLRKEYKSIYSEYCNVRKHLQQEKERIEKNRDNEEYFKFQLSQIKPLKLKDGEQENLEQSYKVLSNVAEIKEKIYLATEWIGNGTSSVLTKLQKTLTSLESIREMFDASGQIIERLEPILIELQDIYDTLNGEVDNLTDNPAELAEIDTRLNMIYALQQKHHVGTVAELIEIQKDLEKSLSEIQNSDKELSGLEAKLKDLEKSLSETADNLSKSRMEAASVFEKELIDIAVPLGLKNLQFKVYRKKIEYNSLGNDSVTFSVGFNKNQQLMPVEKTASGGELSRLMLSIKYIIAKSMQLPSIIFDEIDTGVSGEIANKIGEMMKKISKQIQVITITHLPQVAALGDCHFKVYKKDNDNTTITNIKQLDNNDRVLEIAGMLSGATINDAAIENAKSLLKL